MKYREERDYGFFYCNGKEFEVWEIWVRRKEGFFFIVLDVGIGYGDLFNKYKEYLLDVMFYFMCWKFIRIYNLENR